jgi:hypothetical protein
MLSQWFDCFLSPKLTKPEARADAVEDRKTIADRPPLREDTIHRMVETRQRAGGRMHREEPVRNWTTGRLLVSAEAAILENHEQYSWLRDAGLTEEAAWKTVASRRANITIDALPDIEWNGDGYVRHRLTVVNSVYLRLDERVLGQVLATARDWVEQHVRAVKEAPPWPPLHWLHSEVSAADVDQHETDQRRLGATAGGERVAFVSSVLDDASESLGWRRLRGCIAPGDALWTFDSPGDYWRGLAGRAGIALLRDGRPIDHIVTVMN